MKTSDPHLISIFEYLGFHVSHEERNSAYEKALRLGEPVEVNKCTSSRYKKTTYYFRREFLDKYFKEKKEND